MTDGRSAHEYRRTVTQLCERALVTLLGSIGPWRQRIYLVGGLAPRYLVGEAPPTLHIGTSDVDVVIALSLDDDSPETYATLETNLRRAGFEPTGTSFRWRCDIDEVKIELEFLCETTAVAPGRIYKPRGEGTGANLGAFNVHGAQLVASDFREVSITADRIEGGRSTVALRVADLVAFTVLKVTAFQDRHQNKDAYDLVYVLANWPGGPSAAGMHAVESEIVDRPQVLAALRLLGDRFSDEDADGAVAYADFLADVGDFTYDQLRQQAVAAVRAFLGELRSRGKMDP